MQNPMNIRKDFHSESLMHFKEHSSSTGVSCHTSSLTISEFIFSGNFENFFQPIVFDRTKI